MVLFGNPYKTQMVTADEALKGSATRRFEVPRDHAVLGTPLEGPGGSRFWLTRASSCSTRRPAPSTP